MSPEDLEDMLSYILEGRKFEGYRIHTVETFEEAKRITNEHGVVINVEDGSEFEVFIRQTMTPIERR